MNSTGARARRLSLNRIVVLMLGLLLGLSACGQAESTTQPVNRLPKLGTLSNGRLVDKLPTPPASPLDPNVAGRELALIVSAMETVLRSRPGLFAVSTAHILDNETLAAENQNPEYGYLLTQWGRQTGYRAAFEPTDPKGSPGLLWASVILSRYGTSDGARAAYSYVLQAQSAQAERLDLKTPSNTQAPWDEATVFYTETLRNGQVHGVYTLVFRVRGLIGFVSNSGLADGVSTRDMADLTEAIFERLRLVQ